MLRALPIAALMAATPAVAAAQPSDPAASRIEAYHQATIGVMKDGPKLGMKGRTARFQPIVADFYSAAMMAQIVVGMKWASLSPADRSAATAAMARHTAVSLASNFDSFNDEKFTVVPQSKQRGVDRLVSASIGPKTGSPTQLIYRMRQSGGQWKIIDVMSSGVSQLTMQRSELAQSIDTGGVAGMVKKLDEIAAKMLSAP